MIKIKLGNRDVYALIDDEDEWVTKWKWRAIPSSNKQKWYVARSGPFYYVGKKMYRPTIYLHRFIMNCPLLMEIDHINGDSLDCRRSNMEIVTQTENNIRAGARRRANGKSLIG